MNDCQAARQTGIPRTTVRNWRVGLVRSSSRDGDACRACGHPPHDFDTLPAAYVYLLGLYLGDGHISRHRRDVYRLSISLDMRYPNIIEECRAAMTQVLPGNKVAVAVGAKRAQLAIVSSYSKQWPCLLPQHGPGRKHERPIELTVWQRRVVTVHVPLLIRGLIHSDGSRSTNRVAVNGRTYEYLRYSFSNASPDIRRIFCEACDELGIRWRQMNARNISVAKRDSVAMLDQFVGPKS
jgi:hypothetical protein